MSAVWKFTFDSNYPYKNIVAKSNENSKLFSETIGQQIMEAIEEEDDDETLERLIVMNSLF